MKKILPLLMLASACGQAPPSGPPTVSPPPPSPPAAAPSNPTLIPSATINKAVIPSPIPPEVNVIPVYDIIQSGFDYKTDQSDLTAQFEYYTDQDNEFYISKNHTGKKILYFPGLAQGAENYLGYPYSANTRALLKAGYTVIFTNNPNYLNSTKMMGPYVDLFAANGADYMTAFAAMLDRKFTFLNTILGSTTEYIYNGTSFGGFHALLAQCLRPQEWTFVSLPVILPESLFGRTDVNTSEGIMSAGCQAIYQQKHIALQYGTIDVRAFPEPIEAFIPFAKVEYVIRMIGMGHQTTTYGDSFLEQYQEVLIPSH